MIVRIHSVKIAFFIHIKAVFVFFRFKRILFCLKVRVFNPMDKALHGIKHTPWPVLIVIAG